MRNAIFATVLLVFAYFMLAQGQARVSTRFGWLEIGKHKELLFRGHPFDPSIVGNNSLDIGETFHVEDSDVVLITNYGGTACPYLFYFVSVSKAGVKATRSFGTCNKVIQAKQSGDSIRITMHDYRGPFEPEAERIRAFREVRIFVFSKGAVKEEKTN
jgi:hypothetical protein